MQKKGAKVGYPIGIIELHECVLDFFHRIISNDKMTIIKEKISFTIVISMIYSIFSPNSHKACEQCSLNANSLKTAALNTNACDFYSNQSPELLPEN